MSFCKTISTKGIPIDYRPAVQHSLFKLDSTFDFRFGALRHCKAAINKFARQVFWGFHKTLFSSLVENIKKEKQSDDIHITFVTTGLSDSDRSFFINEFLQQLNNQDIGMVVDVMNTRNATAREILSMMADQLNYYTIDPINVHKAKATANIASLSKEQINETPLKAISSLFTTRNNSNKYTTHKLNDTTKTHQNSQNNTLIVILRHCEMIDVHTLDNLFLLLNGPDVDFNVHIIAYTDTLCQLPTQLSAAAQACIHTNITSMVSPWELYETIFGRLYSGRDIPIVFSKVLVDAIRRSFEETDLCITSALHRFELCLVRHFEQPLSLLAMYKETAFLQQMNILSRSERLHQVVKKPPSQQPHNGSGGGSVNSGANPLSHHSRSGTLESTTSIASTAAAVEEEEDLHTVLTTTDADNNTISTADTGTMGDRERPATILPGNYHDHTNTTSTEIIEKLSKQKLLHRLGISAILALLKPEHLEDTGLAYSTTQLTSLLEVQDCRSRVDNIWFLFLKTLRSDLLGEADQSRFGADLLWADIHNASISMPVNTNNTSTTTTTTTSTTSAFCIVCNQLLNKLRESIPTHSLNILYNTLHALNTMLTSHLQDINNEDHSTYYFFLHTLYEGVSEHYETVEILLETFQMKEINTKLSLNKMKQLYINSNKRKNERIDVNIQERNVISTETTTATTTSTTAASTTATNIEESNIVSLDMVTLFSQALIDFMNWLPAIAQQYSDLPVPTHIVAQETNNKEIMHVQLSGIVRFLTTTEIAVLEDINPSLHTTFVSAWENPTAVLPALDPLQNNNTSSSSTTTNAAAKSDRKRAATAVTKNKQEPVRVFSPDTAVLYQIFKSSPARDTAAVWFQHFKSILKTQISTWEEDINPSNGVTGSNKKRKRSNRSLELDDATVLKARFISALYELERGGFIRCSNTGNSSSARGRSSTGKTGGVVTIDRLMFNWV